MRFRDKSLKIDILNYFTRKLKKTFKLKKSEENWGKKD